MPFAEIDGVVLHYRLSGREGAPVLAFSNSLGTDMRIWDAVLERLAGRYRLLTYDKRGHGLSDAPAVPYALDDHVDDLVGLLDRHELGEVVLIGVSLGGMIAQRFAARFPRRLRGAVLSNTAAKIGTAEMWNARIATIRQGGMEAISEALMQRWFSDEFRNSRPAELAGWRNMLERSPAIGYANSCASVRDADLSADAATITVPVLAVAGRQDLSTLPELVEDTARRIPNARFAVISSCGHLPSIEQPEEFTALLNTFLRDIGHV